MADDLVQSLIHNAKLAEQGERYEDMANFMRQVAQKADTMNSEQRNLLSVAYKNIVGSRRTALRILSSIKEKEEKRDPDGYKLKTVIEYKLKLEAELDEMCLDLLDQVLNDDFLGKEQDIDSKVFFLKMKGDYYRYMAEYKEGDAVAQVCKSASDCYSKAWELAQGLEIIHPIRLGLALNFSVFYYEIMNNKEKACQLAKESYEAAKGVIGAPQDSDSKDSSLIIQLLCDNLSLWEAPEHVDDEDPDEPPREDIDA